MSAARCILCTRPIARVELVTVRSADGATVAHLHARCQNATRDRAVPVRPFVWQVVVARATETRRAS